MNTSQLIETCHNAAKEKGFWHKERNMQEAFALILSELYEAFESHRKGRFAELKDGYFNAVNSRNAALVRVGKDKIDFYKHDFESYIKDTLEDELADVLIRIFDFCGGFNLQLNEYFIWGKLNDDSIFKNTNNIGEKILRITYISTKYYYEVNKIVAIIGIVDYVIALCQELNIDIETHINLKLQYNATRAKLHGKNY